MGEEDGNIHLGIIQNTCDKDEKNDKFAENNLFVNVIF